MATLNERDRFRQDERDNLRENRVIAEDIGGRSAGSLGYGLILALGLALLAWFAFGTPTTTRVDNPVVNAPATSPPSTAIPERQTPNNP